MTLYEISNDRSSHKNFADSDGFIYGINSQTSNTLYFKCKNSKYFTCPGRVTVRNKNLEDCFLSVQHNHDPDESIKDLVIFQKKMEQIIKDNPFMKCQECYNKAKRELRGQINMNHIPIRPRLQTFFHRISKNQIPLLPSSIAEFEELIKQYSDEFSKDERGNIFFRGIWSGTTGQNIVFLSETVLNEVNNLKRVTLLLDGTFKVLPYHLKFCQLYIINVIIKSRSFPLAYILMERRDCSSYEVIFSGIKQLIPSVKVETCMTDYEAATRKALRIVFPKVRLAGCYFHYVKAVTKQFRRFGLKKDEKFEGVLQLVTALALLPNEYVMTGFEIISSRFKKSKRWNAFKEYWYRQWAPANISVYGLRHRTNNFAESLNKTINSLVQHKHPNIWILIQNLKSVEMDKSDELDKAVLGAMIDTKKNQRMNDLNKQIEKAVNRFDEGQDVEAFLQNIAFNIQLQSFFKERIELNREVDPDDGDYFDSEELFKANDFNLKSSYYAPKGNSKKR